MKATAEKLALLASIGASRAVIEESGSPEGLFVGHNVGQVSASQIA